MNRGRSTVVALAMGVMAVTFASARTRTPPAQTAAGTAKAVEATVLRADSDRFVSAPLYERPREPWWRLPDGRLGGDTAAVLDNLE